MIDNVGQGNSRSSALDRANDEAAEWVVKKSLGLSSEEKEQYESWLQADPVHRDREMANHRVWGDMDLLKQGISGEDGKPDKRLLRPASLTSKVNDWQGKAAFISLAAAACIAVGIFFIGREPSASPLHDGSFSMDYHATELRRDFLPDGSLMELRDGSEAFIRFEKGMRHVLLLSGEVHVSVTEDPERPFVVQAGTARFQAIGTSFDVSLEEDKVELLVTEGKVRINRLESDESAVASSLSGFYEEEILVNQHAILPLASRISTPIVKAISEDQVQEMTSWKSEILDFEATPLSEVILEFNRRNRDQLELADDSLGSLEIDGSFRSDHLPAFARLISISAGIQADRSESGVILLHR